MNKMEKEVILYSTPTCAHCGKVRSVLKEEKVKYEEYNVKKNEEKRKEMVRKTGQVIVPTIVIGEDIVVGSNLERIKRLLKTK